MCLKQKLRVHYFANNEHTFTLVKLKTIGHGGEVIKRLLCKSKKIFYNIMVGWFIPKTIQ